MSSCCWFTIRNLTFSFYGHNFGLRSHFNDVNKTQNAFHAGSVLRRDGNGFFGNFKLCNVQSAPKNVNKENV